jgi:hypothetical protein
MEEDSCVDTPILEEKIERLSNEIDEEETLLNFSQLLEEKISYHRTPESEFEWLVEIKPKRVDRIEKEINIKKQRLEHCINFLMDDELCEEDDKVYIKSPGKPNWYLDMEKDSMSVKLIFCDFYQCIKDRQKIPEEIEVLKDILDILKN